MTAEATHEATQPDPRCLHAATASRVAIPFAVCWAAHIAADVSNAKTMHLVLPSAACLACPSRWVLSVLTAATCFGASLAAEFNEYCVVGAGPAGIQVSTHSAAHHRACACAYMHIIYSYTCAHVQLGIFMEKAKRDYVIFEKENLAVF